MGVLGTTPLRLDWGVTVGKLPAVRVCLRGVRVDFAGVTGEVKTEFIREREFKRVADLVVSFS